MFAMLAVFGLAACDESDYEYVAPEAVTGTQVYFPTTNPTSIDLEGLTGEFTVPITRVDSTAAAVVTLEVTSTSDKYTLPQSVSFAAGQKNAELSVSYAGLEYEDIDTLRFKLVDNSTPYGTSEYVVAVGCPAPWTPWIGSKDLWVRNGYAAAEWPLSETANTCSYTYTQIFGGEDTDMLVYYRKSLIDSEVAQIRIDNWCMGVTLILDYNPKTHAISIEPQFTGYTDGGVGDFYITDVTHWQGAAIPGYESWYDPEKGQINLCTAWMAGANHSACYGYGYEYVQLAGFYIPDYTVNAVLEGTLTDTNQDTYALLNVTAMGVDVESAKALVVSKEDDAAAVADAILAGDVEAADLVLGNNKLSLNDLTGELQVVVVSIANNELQSVKALAFEYYGGGSANPWQSIGTGLYTDCFVAPMFSLEVPTYEVEIMENSETPGLYRVMNPYSNSVYPYAEGDCAEEGLYLEVNATDPEAVYINTQPIGVDWGYGEMAICSWGGYGLEIGNPFDALKANGYFGVKQNGYITLPTFSREASDGSTIYYQGMLFMGADGYYAGGNNGFCLALPEAKNEAPAKVSALVRQTMAARRLVSRKMAASERTLPKMVKTSFKLQTSIEK